MRAASWSFETPAGIESLMSTRLSCRMFPCAGNSADTRRAISSPKWRTSASVSPGMRSRSSSMWMSSALMVQNPLPLAGAERSSFFRQLALQAAQQVTQFQQHHVALGVEYGPERGELDLRAG